MPALDMLTSDDIDKLILEQGMSLGTQAFEFLTVDEETAVTIQELEQILNEKIANEEYD